MGGIVPSLSIGYGDAALSLCAMPNTRKTLGPASDRADIQLSRGDTSDWVGQDWVGHWLNTNDPASEESPGSPTVTL